MSELWSEVCHTCGYSKDGCQCRKIKEERRIKTDCVLLTITRKEVIHNGGFILFHAKESLLDFQVTAGLHAFVVYRKGTNIPLLLRAKEVEVGDKIWFDIKLVR
jgi:hypothetical protein